MMNGTDTRAGTPCWGHAACTTSTTQSQAIIQSISNRHTFGTILVVQNISKSFTAPVAPKLAVIFTCMQERDLCLLPSQPAERSAVSSLNQVPVSDFKQHFRSFFCYAVIVAPSHGAHMWMCPPILRQPATVNSEVVNMVSVTFFKTTWHVKASGHWITSDVQYGGILRSIKFLFKKIGHHST